MNGGACAETLTVPEPVQNGGLRRVSVNTVSSTAARRGAALSFKDIVVNAGEKEILKGVSGSAERGQMLAIMGPSGAGKTTLLNILAGRLKKSYSQKGTVYFDSHPLNKRLRRRISYVLQSDVFFSFLTLKRSLTYSALLRLPTSMTKKEKLTMVDHAIEALRIKHCEQTIFGNAFVTGMSGGEKKRASIAAELLTDPAIMMLDEPTSGLDSSSARSLLQTLKHLAKEEQKTLIASIHQPNTQCYNEFDKVLLLCEGEIAYIGPTNAVMEYFSSIGYPCKGNYNPADYIIELVSESEKQRKRIVELFKERGSHFLSSRSCPPLSRSLKTPNNLLPISEDRVSRVSDSEGYPMSVVIETNNVEMELENENISLDNDDPKFATSFFTQFTVLTQRGFHQARPDILSTLNLVQNLILAIIAGIAWFQSNNDEVKIRDKYGFYFFHTVYWSFHAMFPAAIALGQERAVIYKERASGSYRLSAYFLAKCVSELPLIITYPFMFLTISYWMAGMRDFPHYVYAVLILWLGAITSQSLGLLVGSIVTSVKRVIATVAVVLLTLMLLGGFYVNQLPSWLDWGSYLSPIYYAFCGMLTLEFSGGPLYRCSHEASGYEICANLTSVLAQNGSDFLIPGTDILDKYGITLAVWQSVVGLLSITLVSRTAAYLVLRFGHKPA
eukprot:m.114964 g.114964  ORF g.114964 m.114964 type:complete len:670 (+) comp37527_c0_seq1:84-2093(+)